MKQLRAGLAFGAGAYGMWGALPFYFTLIMVVGPFEIVPWRVLFTLIFCTGAITVMRKWAEIRRIVSQPKLVGMLATSGVLLYINWQVFVYGVLTDRIIETSLGYFINPLVTILIGVVVRKEQLSRPQWVAVGIAFLGVTTAAIGYGRFPWISIGLAFSFGLYGALHKEIGTRVNGLTGLTVETIVTVPIAVVQAVAIHLTVGLTAFSFGAATSVLIVLSGVMTAVPLILFGEAATRLPLATLGFLQFLTPVLSFLYGVFVAGETMSVTRWVGFVCVWIALMILVIGLVRQLRTAPGRVVPGLHTGPIPLD